MELKERLEVIWRGFDLETTGQSIFLKNLDDESEIIMVTIGCQENLGEYIKEEKWINLEIETSKKFNDLSIGGKYFYKGCTIYFEDAWGKGEWYANIGRGWDLDIKQRDIAVGREYSLSDEDVRRALTTALDLIDEAILKNGSKTNREKLIDIMQLPSNIKSLSRYEQNTVLIRYIYIIKSAIEEIKGIIGNYEFGLGYKFSSNQITAKNNVIKSIYNKKFLEAYYYIIDYVDKRDDKDYLEISYVEKEDIFKLISMLYDNIKMELKIMEEEKQEETNKENLLYEEGNKYYFGKGVEKDYKKAFAIFKNLADNKEHLKAMEALCYMYYYGKGIDVDYELARKYCEKVEQKNSKCSRNIFQFLGEIYFGGLGVEADYIKAKTYFEKALNDKYDDTYYKLALLNSGNYGIEKNEEKAKKYFEKIEFDLCIALIYYVLAIKPEEEQSLDEIVRLLNSETEMNIVKESLLQFPQNHPSKLYHDRLSYLTKEEYKDIVEKLKNKIDICREQEMFKNILMSISSDEEVVKIVKCIVEFTESKTEIVDLANKIDSTAIFTNSYYNASTNFSYRYTIDYNGIIEEYYDTKSIKAKIDNQELERIKELIGLIQENYVDNLNPESILNPNSQKNVVTLYHDFGVEEKKVYNDKEGKWITIYQYGDVMGYNDTKETKEIIELTENLYKKYFGPSLKKKEIRKLTINNGNYLGRELIILDVFKDVIKCNYKKSQSVLSGNAKEKNKYCELSKKDIFPLIEEINFDEKVSDDDYLEGGGAGNLSIEYEDGIILNKEFGSYMPKDINELYQVIINKLNSADSINE